MLLLGLEIGYQKGGTRSSSMVWPLTEPLLAVVFPKGQSWGPSFLSSTPMTWTSCLSSMVPNFADDTRLGIDAADLESVFMALQRDLVSIGQQSTVRQMPVNLDKCHVLHVGTANQAENYFLLDSEISSINKEKDLGGYHHGGPQELCAMNCCGAERAKDPGLHKVGTLLPEQAGSTLVRPLLEYGTNFWAPITWVYIKCLLTLYFLNFFYSFSGHS